MSERPILFSAPMVRAILAGQKTMARRVVKPQPPEDAGEIVVGLYHPTETGRDGEEQPGREVFGAYDYDGTWGARCPYGASGDLLWVREAWWPSDGERLVAYRADTEMPPWMREAGDRWRPSIHMPRWASRLTLRVTDVRVERVQEITEEDARAEGIQANPDAPASLTDRSAFAKLWDTLNAKRGHGWDVNPWVWVVSFERTEVAHV